LILPARPNDYNRGAIKDRAPCRSGKSGEFRREGTALRLTPLVLLTVLGIAQAGARDETQIHSHMCYAEFNDIIDAVAAMDADVISIETSRSRMELLEAFTKFQYPSGIGPGVYDIHSPHVPEQTDMLELLYKARTRLKPDQLWINPDCGLKTRDWPEVKAALSAMVGAAKALRQQA